MVTEHLLWERCIGLGLELYTCRRGQSLPLEIAADELLGPAVYEDGFLRFCSRANRARHQQQSDVADGSLLDEETDLTASLIRDDGTSTFEPCVSTRYALFWEGLCVGEAATIPILLLKGIHFAHFTVRCMNEH